MLRLSFRSALVIALAASMACDGTTDPDPPAAGDIRVIADTYGFEIDEDGYTVRIDGGPPRTLPANGFLIAERLQPGEHTVVLSGIPEHCTAIDGSTASVVVVEDATADVEFEIGCAHPNPPVVIDNVALDGRPYGAAISADGVIYVALIGTSELRRGDLATMDFGPTVTVGSTPPHVVFAPDGNTVYATLQWGQGLAVVDVATNSLVTVIPLLADGFNLIVSPDGERVYATDAAGHLYAIDPATNEIVGDPLMVGQAANGLVFSPDGATLYVTARDAGTVTAVSTATFTITRTYTVGGMPQRIAVSPDGGTLYVANEISGLNVVNVASGGVTSYTFGTAAYGIGIDPAGEMLYVLLPQEGVVVVIHRESFLIVTVLEVGGIPRNIVFDATGETAIVTTEASVAFIR